MRPAADLFPSIPAGKMAAAGARATFAPPPAVQRSPWQSPVPYLFGGLAAMMGLIAFALLILACSYWKLSGDGDEKGDGGSEDKAPPVFEEKFLVIMAGDINPTFLATPVSNSKACFLKTENGDGAEDSGKEQSH